MNLYLLGAAILVFVTGLAHSLLGECWIISPLLKRKDLPALFGDDGFTRGTIRFAWHLLSLAWWAIAGVLFAFAGAILTPAAQFSLRSIALCFLVSALFTSASTRGRHLAWTVFLAIAWLTWNGSQYGGI